MNMICLSYRIATTSLYSFPLMLKTTRLLARMLTLRRFALTSAGRSQRARLAWRPRPQGNLRRWVLLPEPTQR